MVNDAAAGEQAEPSTMQVGPQTDDDGERARSTTAHEPQTAAMTVDSTKQAAQLPFEDGGAPDGPPPTTTPEQLAQQLANLKVDAPTAARTTTSRTRRLSAEREPSRADGAVEEEWLLKEIFWPPLPPSPSDPVDTSSRHPAGFVVDPSLKVKIVCQNENGPCSLIALCNILILRNDLHIPPGRESVSYSYLSNLLADYFLSHTRQTPSIASGPDDHLSSVLSILPQTRHGINLNPCFDRIDGFASNPPCGSDSPSVVRAPELALFGLASIPLLHGWVADPSYGAETYAAVLDAGNFDKAMERVVEGAEIVGGGGVERLKWLSEGGGDASEEEMLDFVEKRSQWSPQEESKAQRAQRLHSFLEATSTQLTYPGLAALCQTPALLPPSSLAALFRNSHLSVLYRRPTVPPPRTVHGEPDWQASFVPPGPELFTLVTDAGLGTEGAIVWESLGDVDGGGSDFYDARLRRARIRGGDWVGGGTSSGRTRRESATQRPNLEETPRMGDHDLALAQQLQAEEDAYTSAQLQHAEEQRRHEQNPPAPQTGGRPPASATSPAQGVGRGKASRGKDSAKGKKDEKCLVM